MMPARMLMLGSITLTALLLAGCQPKSGTVVPVTGKVFYKGVPLQTGLIVFTPDATRGESGPSAYGEIRPDGSYALKTGDTVGASTGWYRVTVASLNPSVSVVDTTPVSNIPEKYRDPQLAQLQCQVKLTDYVLDFKLVD